MVFPELEPRPSSPGNGANRGGFADTEQARRSARSIVVGTAWKGLASKRDKAEMPENPCYVECEAKPALKFLIRGLSPMFSVRMLPGLMPALIE